MDYCNRCGRYRALDCSAMCGECAQDWQDHTDHQDDLGYHSRPVLTPVPAP